MARTLRHYRLPAGTPWSCYGTPPSGAVEVPGPGAPVHEAPAKRAPKPEWVDHAVALGVPRAEAEGLTKAQLQDRVEELVAAAESRGPVGSDVQLVDHGTQPDHLGAGPGDGAAVDQDGDGGSEVVVHDGGA